MEARTNNEELATPRLLQAQTHIWNHMLSYLNSMSLKSAIDLNIIDTIHNHGKPMPLPTLISSLQIHPSKTRHIHRLMRILTYSGFFSLHNLPETDNDHSQDLGYALTDASTLLLKDHPLSMRPFFVFHLNPIFITPWFKLPSWFQNDDLTPFVTTHEKTFWEYAGQEPKMNQNFNETMASDSRLVSSLVVNKCKGVFEGLESLVDIGGGTGTLAKAIANMLPEMECIVFDLPHVVGGLQSNGNLRFVSGDMFEAIPFPSNDAVLLKWILHNWNDEECVKILKKCKEAITTNKGKEGKVIIIDMMMENDKGDIDDEFVKTQLFFDMLMMVINSAYNRLPCELMYLA